MEVLHSSLVTCLQFRIAMLTVSYRYDVTSFARSSDIRFLLIFVSFLLFIIL